MWNCRNFTFAFRLVLVLLASFSFNRSIANAQSADVFLTADRLQNKYAEFSLNNTSWLYHPGDDLKWSRSGVKDSDWLNVQTNFGSSRMLPDWKGIGWFRLWLSADTSLTRKALALRINHDGASELYIDGELKGGFGEVGRAKGDMKGVRAPFDLISFQLNDTKRHLIAIRYSNYEAVYPDFIGFQAWVGNYKKLQVITQNNRRYFEYMLLSLGAQLALALLHMFLFVFYPTQKLNLYYFIFSMLFAGTNWAVYAQNVTSSPATQYLFGTIFWICAILVTASAWHLLYKVSKVPILKWKMVAISAMTVVYLTKYITALLLYRNDGFAIYFLIVMLDGLWTLFRAIQRKQEHTWLIGLGMLLIMLLYFFVGADVFGLWTNFPARSFAMSMGILVFPLCFSIYLALEFARTNQDLSFRLAQVEELSADALKLKTEKLELITEQANKLEVTVLERTAEVQRQADKLLEMDRVKSRFFINLTHEFRTPLTLILGPVQQILSYVTDTPTRTRAGTIYRNAERLLQLINQLLDLSKLEAGKMELIDTPVDLVAFIKNNFLSFESLAAEKQISLRFDSEWTSLWLLTDEDKLGKIVYNLMSNALKFTSAGGSISLGLTANDHHTEKWIRLTVKDTGVGIPESKIPYVFDRFYQVDQSDTRTREGTGIGLAITKELTQLLGGSLLLQSKEGAGTEVSILLPVREANSAIRGAALLPSGDDSPYPFVVHEHEEKAMHEENIALTRELPLILIIDDIKEIRDFIGSILTGDYRLICAANGEQGIAMANENIPDLVVTDLMMPVVDGFTVCAALKRNETTSHIPVVILTAKADTPSRITGLETKADAYLSKPFDERELLAIIQNLILLRRQLRERYAKENIWLTNAEDLPGMEKVFLEKVRKAVELHLDDERYSVELLGEAVGLSRTQLHRKLKGLIGQSPGDLIRIIRLQRSYELLKNKVGTVAEVSYMVGYGNPQNFSTSFSRHFGFPPSEAVKN
jgi:signal transduction histidine kinase/DNA-binding response OmpR family regulator